MKRLIQHNGVVVLVKKFYAKNISQTAQPQPKKLDKKRRLEDLLLNMTTKAAHVPAMKAARAAKKENTPKYPAGVIKLQVLGSGANGAPTSLYIFADQSRYLFNCGEGTQRLAHEHKMKLGKLEHVFITSKQWNKIGGLPGMALTTQDIGVPVLTLHGPPGLDQLFRATSRFIVLKELHVRAADCLDNPYYEDHVIKVDYVPIYPDSEVSVSPNGGSTEDALLSGEDSNIDYYPTPDGSKRQIEISREEVSKKIKSDLGASQSAPGSPYETPIQCAMCFICRPKAKEGTLLIDKCVEKGVPPGPLLGRLKAGHDVTLANGTVVFAKDVRSPDCLGPVFIVTDCPSLEYLDSLVMNPVWQQYQNSSTEDENMKPQIIVHFTPERVFLDPRYQSWLERFGSTKHLVLNDSCRSFGSEAVHRLQSKLHQFDQNIFPLLYRGGERVRHPTFHQDDIGNWRRYLNEQKSVTFVSEPELPPQLSNTKVPVVVGETLLRYNIRPHQGFDTSNIVSYNDEDYEKEISVSERFPEELTALKERLRIFSSTVDEFPKIVFHGTGSSIPNKGRNVSGIQLQINENTRMILDCGEGTYGQLCRFYGPSRVNNVLTELKAIYISHLHADHHLGLITILKGRAAAFDALSLPFQPVILFAPHQILFWLKIFHTNFEKIRSLYKLVPNISLMEGYDGAYPITDLPEILESLDLQKIETCAVRHCANSFGVALVHKSSWKVTYSGDTMPSDNLVRIGVDSDVCIHEATMEDDLEHEAKLKQHCTTSQAIDIGQKMNAKFTLLTHFSQRYAKVPKIDGNLAPNVGIAFDNMQVRLGDLPKIPLMYPAFKILFQEDYEDMENKTKKKLKQRERDAVKVAAKAAEIAEADN